MAIEASVIVLQKFDVVEEYGLPTLIKNKSIHIRMLLWHSVGQPVYIVRQCV